MAGTERYRWSVVARRVAARTIRHVLRDPIILLGLTVIVAVLVLGMPAAALSGDDVGSVPTEDAAEQYMRGLRDRGVAEVFASLSPDMRRSLEQRTGLLGP